MKAVVWAAFHLEAPEIIERYVVRVVDELASRGHCAVVCMEAEEAVREVADADVLVCWRVLPEMLAAATRLRWIQFGSAGIDHTLFPELLDSDVVLTTLAGIHSVPLAEHVLALMLAMSRRLDICAENQVRHTYDRGRAAVEAEVLAGKTVGIVGLGRIGERVARLCKALGMSVLGVRRVPERVSQYVDEMVGPAKIGSVLSRSDYLVLIVPLTGSTRGMIGAREIGEMKAGARLVNVARGAMVDTQALLDALRLGRLAGAALDVFEEEPLPDDSPLWDAPGVILTPHVGGAHPSYDESAFAIFQTNLKAFECGGAMQNVFDRSRGY